MLLRNRFLALFVLGLSPLLAQAQVRSAGRVLVTNQTRETLTITCRYYFDAFGNRQTVKGGSWTISPGNRAYLNDLGLAFMASHFEFTLGTREGNTQWHAKNFDGSGNLNLMVGDELLRQHRARLTPVVRFAPPPGPAAGRAPTDDEMKRAIGKIIGAAIAQHIASKEPENLLEGVLVEAARRARDELVEGALKDVFPGRPLREIQAGRRVICLGLDGKLTTAHLNQAQARDALMGRLRALDPDIATGAQMADFIHAVLQARRR